MKNITAIIFALVVSASACSIPFRGDSEASLSSEATSSKEPLLPQGGSSAREGAPAGPIAPPSEEELPIGWPEDGFAAWDYVLWSEEGDIEADLPDAMVELYSNDVVTARISTSTNIVILSYDCRIGNAETIGTVSEFNNLIDRIGPILNFTMGEFIIDSTGEKLVFAYIVPPEDELAFMDALVATVANVDACM